MELSRVCLVCTAPINVTHLGIDACRACAAFFKRTVLAARTYTCRQGDGKCEFRKHEKFMCRSCRYNKCISFGMEYSNPQKRRPRKAAVQPAEEPVASPSSSSSRSTSSAPESLLDRIAEEYNDAFERRMEQERRVVANHRLLPMIHPTESFYMCNISAYSDILRLDITESIALLKRAFPDFEQMSVENRATLFKNFIGKFALIEGLYLSSKYCRGTNKFMASLITAVDMDDFDHWIPDDGTVERKDDMRSAMKGFSIDYMTLLVPLTKLDELTEREFHALIVIVYCDVDALIDLPDDLVQRAAAMRTRVFEELQEYYKTELALVDYSKRLGNLMIVAQGAGEAGNLMNEEFRMYATMFGMYSDDSLFREIFID